MATARTTAVRGTSSGFGPLQIAITLLVALTAFVHLFNGVSLIMGLSSPSAQEASQIASMGGSTMVVIRIVLFFCNFGGYVVLVTALYLPRLRPYQGVTRALLVGYTMVTVVAYFALEFNALNLIGLSDKAVEAALIVLLLVERKGARASDRSLRAQPDT